MHTLSRGDALLFGAAAFGSLALPARAQSAGAVRVGATANDTYAEAYYAQDLGIFKKAGLDVTITTFGNGAAVSSAVAGGAVDVGISNPVQLANAIARDIPFVLIAGGGLYATKAPTTVMCVAKTSPLRTAKDLDGKTIAVSALRDVTQAAAEAWLAQRGAEVGSMKFIELTFSEMGPGLERGTVDAAVISEPSLTGALHSGGARVFGKVYDAIADQFLIGTWFSTSDWVKRSPELARRYAAAIYETARWANGHQAESGAILAKYAKLDPQVAQTMTRCLYATSLDQRWVQAPIDLAFKYHVVPRDLSAAQIIAK